MIDPPVEARAASGQFLVVGVDGSLASHMALEWACAEADKRGLAVHVVTAIPGSCALYPSGYGIAVYNEAGDARHDAEALIADELSWARSRWPDLHLAGHTVKGDPRRVLRAMAATAKSLVIGTSHVHPGGVSLLSPLADALIARAATPVVVVADAIPPCAEGPVVVGINANAQAHGVLSYAFQHAQEHGADIRAVTCWQRRRHARGPAVLGSRHLAELWLFDTLAAWRCRYPKVPASGIVIDNHPAGRLLAESANARLLVLSKKRRRSVTAIRNGAEPSLLPHGCRPVAVVPTP